MKKITIEATEAFVNCVDFKKNNTVVTSCGESSKMVLHGNTIAIKNSKNIKLSNCGYYTQTTKERLNGILSALNLGCIKQKNGKWFFNGNEFIESLVIKF